MKSKLTLAATAMAVAISTAMAPDPEETFQFIPSAFDFGSIREDDGEVSAIVKAVNVSPDTTFITSVRTSCGCTGATYTDRILAPGDTAEIAVSYNPENRPGRFLKTIKIFSGPDRASSAFKIKGNVVPSEKSISKSYPHRIGDLHFSTTLADAGVLSQGEVKPLFIGIYNTGDRPLALKADADNLAIEPKVVPDTLEANSPGTITIMIKSRKLTPMGKEFRHNVYLIDSERADTLATIPVGGSLIKSE